MSKGAVQFNTNDNYYTPKEIVDLFGKFDYDPFTTKENADRLNIPYYDTIETNGFNTDWSKYKRIWINPPFSRKKEVIAKVSQYIGKDIEIYILLPIETLTNSYMKTIEPYDIYIPSGRIKFMDKSFNLAKSPAFGSVIIKINGSNKWIRI